MGAALAAPSSITDDANPITRNRHYRTAQAMIEDAGKAAPQDAPARNIDALLLAAGGVAAAFGAVSCCALPLLLGSFGVGSA
jgi:hypothetical protein